MKSKKPVIGRRRAIQTFGVLAAAGLLPGCSFFCRRVISPVCPNSPEVSFPAGPLTIDAHCHVFNGTDLQIREFFSKVAVRQGGALGLGANILGSILQELAWNSAPSGEAELVELRNLASVLQVCTQADHVSRLGELRQLAYTNGRQQLRDGITRSPEFRSLQKLSTLKTFDMTRLDTDTRAKVDAIKIIEGLPAHVEDYRTYRADKSMVPMTLKGRSVQGVIDFVLQNFQYRYVSVHDYLRTYNQKGSRVVDLMLPSLVDYDFWLAKGETTKTPLSVQVEVMRQIAIVTGGRVHAFVPFDPLREVAFRLKHSTTDSFSLVTDAIEKYGCVGVKLYPPMGFAALGNKGLKSTDGKPFWERDWLPDWTRRSDLGGLLDDAMTKMLGWCERNDVPVMAHTNISNGVTDEFEALAGSQYWSNALKVFPRLRVSFGHFGDTSLVDDGLERARRFTALMSSDDGAAGINAYADAGYFVEVIRKQPELLDKLRQLYEDSVPPGRAPLATRFMYGTDWEMTLTEGEIDDYLADFVKLFDDLESRPAMREQRLSNLSGRFFGKNAANWIGLHNDEPARRRLDAFYKKNGVATPDWANKLGKKG